MLDVIDEVRRGEYDLRREVTQRNVQHQRIVVEPRRVVDVGLPGDGGKHYHVAGTDQPLGAFMHGDPAPGGARRLEVTEEAGRAVGGQVVHTDLIERPAGPGQEGVDVAGDQARPEEAD